MKSVILNIYIFILIYLNNFDIIQINLKIKAIQL